MEKGEIETHNEGCGYCHNNTGSLIFDFGFGTPVHPQCVVKALHDDPKNSEAIIQAESILVELHLLIPDLQDIWGDLQYYLHEGSENNVKDEN